MTIYDLLDRLPKCPWCGHTGPVSSHGDHWAGCRLTEAWIDREIVVPWEPTPEVVEKKEYVELETALDESLKLQSHQARLLNQYDGGERREFANSAEWIARLRECAILTKLNNQ